MRALGANCVGAHIEPLCQVGLACYPRISHSLVQPRAECRHTPPATSWCEYSILGATPVDIGLRVWYNPVADSVRQWEDMVTPKELVRASGRSQAWLAARMRLTEEHICRLLGGKVRWTEDNRYLFSLAMGLSEDVILFAWCVAECAMKQCAICNTTVEQPEQASNAA